MSGKKTTCGDGTAIWSVVGNYRQHAAFCSLLIVYYYQLYLFETLSITGVRTLATARK
jgi:hypothetical protein